MRGFDFYNPVRVHFGPGVLNQLGGVVTPLAKKVCIVSYKDCHFIQDTLDRVEWLLQQNEIHCFSFYQVEDNPDVATLDEGVSFCRKNNIDLVIGVGGGSAMDAAKAIAAGVHYDSPVWNMVNSRHDQISGIPPQKALPIIQVPTLPATGSEMNQCSVVSNRAIQEKSYIWAECLYAQHAIIDPELTVGLPASLTASAAADSISHVLEIYINGEEDSALPHYFQEGVMRTVMENVQIAITDPGNIEARTNLQWAATCAINGWASPSDAWTPIHQVAHNLTSLHGVAHGPSLAALMPAWMKTFWSRRKERYFEFATRVMDVDADSGDQASVIMEGIRRFEAFLCEINVPTTLAQVGVTTSDLDEIIAGVEKVSFNSDGVLHCIPVVTKADLKEMLLIAEPQ